MKRVAIAFLPAEPLVTSISRGRALAVPVMDPPTGAGLSQIGKAPRAPPDIIGTNHASWISFIVESGGKPATITTNSPAQ